MRAIVLFLLLFLPKAYAQTLSGIVYDETKLPLPGVSVYLDGTSIGTVTDDDGKFSLVVEKRINTSLIFSFIGYELTTVENPFERTKYEVHLQPKASMLKEVVIANDGFSRKSKLRAFREQFLGRTRAGRSCKILNEDEIQFIYDYKTSTLKAYSDNPLKIVNPYLGYAIDFNLVEFNLVFSKKTVNTDFALQSAFAGTTVFHPIADTKHKFASRRRETYAGSQTELFRNLIENKWSNESFLLYKGSFPTDPAEYFTISSHNGMFEVAVKEDAKRNVLSVEAPKFKTELNLLYKKQHISKVIFYVPKFHVDAFGNTDAPMDILFSGEMARLRAGDLLPLDYTP